MQSFYEEMLNFFKSISCFCTIILLRKIRFVNTKLNKSHILASILWKFTFYFCHFTLS